MRMRIGITSDIHTDSNGLAPTLRWISDQVASGGVEVLVIAGDLGVGDPRSPVYTPNVIQALGALPVPVVVVMGNHDFWRSSPRDLFAAIDAVCPPNVHVLRRSKVEIGGKVFGGSTLWFPFSYEAQSQLDGWCDHIFIRKPFDPFQENLWDWAFLQDQGPFDVVVTHHLPCGSVVAPQWVGSSCNCYFVGGSEAQVARVPAPLWVFGHTHTVFDGALPSGGPRLVCNPCGYPREGLPGGLLLLDI